ncbi:MraY family glycosyltransferase [Dyella sp. KRB-257]|uniref:MraY family glycosyltransferase n=1 Tax=Dyella sp. KRB-257 TaxID=3400915 RepID=UPI003C0FE402
MATDVPRLALLILPLLSLLCSGLVVRGAIGYAHRRGMLDQPGQRRSHIAPTPRGGGIGIILAALVFLPVCLRLLPAPLPSAETLALCIGLALVAGTGWWDDHRPLPVLPRLAIQSLAVLILGMAMVADGLPILWLPLLLAAGVGSTNLHNFMDGIDGLLAQQALFVFAGAALLAMGVQAWALAGASLVMLAACLGFWLFNRPPARIFMGDVGSGALGFFVFALAALLWRERTALAWPLATLSASFITDAGLTLAVRIWRGRRWYSAHREHLYQWLVRKGATHRQVGIGYAMWNLAVCAPLAALAWCESGKGWWPCIAAYALTAAAWARLKRRCLRRVPTGDRHVNA